MRVVSRAEFVKLPAGTVFQDFAPCYFGDIRIKGESWPPKPATGPWGPYNGDWWEVSWPWFGESSGDFADACFAMCDKGAEFAVHEGETRRAEHEENLQFAIWSREDVVMLQARIGRALEAGYPAPP